MTDKHNITDMLSSLMGSAQFDPNQQRPWWQSYSFPDTPGFALEDVMNFASSALFTRALSEGLVVYRDSAYAELSVIENPDFSDFRKVVDTPLFQFHVADEAALMLKRNSSAHIKVISLNKELIEKTIKEFEDFYGKVETE